MGDDSLEDPRDVGRPPCQDVVIEGEDIDLGRLLPIHHRWALGADPATILGAVTPVPDKLSEHQFAGLLCGGRTKLAASEGESAHGVKLKEKGGYLHALEAPPCRPHRLLQRTGLVSGVQVAARHTPS